MKIQSINTQPSFTATLKENAVTNNLVKKMNKRQKAEYDQTIELLSKTHKDTTIEYDVAGKDYNITPGGNFWLVNLYGFKNLNNKNLQAGNNRLSKENFLNTLKAVATEGTPEHKKIFNA